MIYETGFHESECIQNIKAARRASRPLSWNICQLCLSKKQTNELKYAMSQFTRRAQTNKWFSHSCKQICSDIWFYEKVYAMSGWDVVTAAGQENTAKKN